jgi:hypothetical protein
MDKIHPNSKEKLAILEKHKYVNSLCSSPSHPSSLANFLSSIRFLLAAPERGL